MSVENVEIVRRVYDAVARRDSDAVLALYHPEVEWDASRGSPTGMLTGTSIAHGHEGLRRWFRQWYEAWKNLEDHLEEVIDAGDQVVSVSTVRATGRVSGLEAEFPDRAAVWTIRQEKIVRVVWYPSRAAALEAVRLSE